MNLSAYTRHALDAVNLAYAAAKELQPAAGMGANHLLLGLIREGETAASGQLAKVGITKSVVLARIEANLPESLAAGEIPTLSAKSGLSALRTAGVLVRLADSKRISATHILRGIMLGVSLAESALSKLDGDRLQELDEWLRGSRLASDE